MSARRFLGWLPALVAAAGDVGTLAGLPAGWPPHALAGVAVSTALDGVLTLARALPLLFLLSWPLLRLENPRVRLIAVGGLWSLLLLAQVALDQYYLVAGTPLGADLFGYSQAEIRTTLAGGIGGGRPAAHLGWALPPLALWIAMRWRARCSTPRNARLGILTLRFDFPKLAPGRYFVAMIPSDPDTGRPLGPGSYRMPVDAGTVTP